MNKLFFSLIILFVLFPGISFSQGYYERTDEYSAGSGKGETSDVLYKVSEEEVNDANNGEVDAWTGVDVSIVGKYASRYGRPPRDPYINTDRGDLLLFVFTLAGVIGGFIIGFNVRRLFYEKRS